MLNSMLQVFWKATRRKCIRRQHIFIRLLLLLLAGLSLLFGFPYLDINNQQLQQPTLNSHIISNNKPLVVSNSINHHLRNMSSTIEESDRTCFEMDVTTSKFQPNQFMEVGLGRSYLELYKQQQLGRRKKFLKVRFVVYNLTSICQPVYYHIHKNGGTTMNVKNHPVVDAYYTPRENELGKKEFRTSALQVMTRIYQTQQHQHQEVKNDDQSSTSSTSSSSHLLETMMPFFTFVRDPVPRFLSSIGQALKLNRLYPCNVNSNQNTNALLDCVLHKIETTNSFLDEHLIPQSFALYTGMMGLNLTITLIDLKHMSQVIDKLLLLLSAQSTPPTTTTSSQRRKTPQVVQGFNLSISNLTPTLIDRICQVYWVDVLMLRSTNHISETICDT